MRVSPRLGSLLVLLALAVGVFAATFRPGCSEPAGIVVLAPDRDDCLVYVDGRLFGTAAKERPLEMRLVPGPHDFRLSRQGSPDLFGRLDLKAGERMVVDAVFATREEPLDPPLEAQPVGLGQTLRVALAPLGGDKTKVWRFRLRGEKGESCLLVVADQEKPFEIEVTDEESGAPIELHEVTETEGFDGREFLEFRHGSSGSIISLRAKSGGKVNPVVLRICKTPPPLVTIKGKVGRRAPPPEMSR